MIWIVGLLLSLIMAFLYSWYSRHQLVDDCVVTEYESRDNNAFLASKTIDGEFELKD